MNNTHTHKHFLFARKRRRKLLLAAILAIASTAAASDPRGADEPSRSPRPEVHETRSTSVGFHFSFSWTWLKSLFHRKDEREEGGLAAPLDAASPLAVKPEKLPPGVSAALPAFDGDSFLAVWRPSPRAAGLSAREVLDEIEPVLRAAGFDRNLADLGAPPDEGTRLPPADLARLADATCGEFDAPGLDPLTTEVCAALRGGVPGPRAEAAFQQAYGVSFAGFRQEIEQPQIEYVFPQIVGGVPIESSGVIATRRAGESLASLHGALFNRYVLANRPKVAADKAWAALEKQLGLAGKRGQPAYQAEALGPFELVLLPDGAGRDQDAGVPALRYAWRGLVRIHAAGEELGDSFRVWIDAEKPALLGLLPQQEGESLAGRPHAEALGMRWRRDPTTPAQKVSFAVDPASPYGLALGQGPGGVFLPLFLGPRAAGGPARGATPDFSRLQGEGSASHCNDAAGAAFRQVNAYAHLFNLWNLAVGAGSLPAFPESPVRPRLDVVTADGSAANYDGYGRGRSALTYAAGEGLFSPSCPDAPNVTLSGAEDATSLAHELAHLAVKRLQDRRPADWCGRAPCPMPEAVGRLLFHDFADAFANAYASTPCQAGWTAKNLGGPNASLACRRHDEGNGLPRLADPATDHFPEHRVRDKGPYPDGQIAAAALWGVRQGMRSKSQAAGTAEYWVRFNRALWRYGFLHPTCTQCEGSGNAFNCWSAGDRDIYRYLSTLLRQMVADQVAVSSGKGWAHAVNKTVAGFARAGLFLVPSACLESRAAGAPALCPAGPRGADAVIDVDDRDPGDDPTVDGVTFPENDYLRRQGVPPRFEVWTGPRFLFDAQGQASLPEKAPCSPFFAVEVANNPEFLATGKGKLTFSSGALPAVDCHGAWTMDAAAWKALAGPAGETRVYYRVKTWGAAGEARLSTHPGGGGFGEVAPPFFVIDESGRPGELKPSPASKAAGRAKSGKAAPHSSAQPAPSSRRKSILPSPTQSARKP